MCPAPATAAGLFVGRGEGDVSKAQLAIELEALANRIRRIRAVGRNGDLEPFLLDRSQCSADADHLAAWERSGRRPADYELAADRARADESRTRYSRR